MTSFLANQSLFVLESSASSRYFQYSWDSFYSFHLIWSNNGKWHTAHAFTFLREVTTIFTRRYKELQRLYNAVTKQAGIGTEQCPNREVINTFFFFKKKKLPFLYNTCIFSFCLAFILMFVLDLRICDIWNPGRNQTVLWDNIVYWIVSLSKFFQ